MSVYHSILGVSENASPSDIKKAYRILARKYHPDINPAADAHDQFIRITEAYEILIGERNAPRNKSTRAYSHEDMANAARERAKQYAKMRYQEFKNQSEAYESTPMHKILWPKWVNFVILAFALLFVVDDMLPLRQIEGTIRNGSNQSLIIEGHRFHSAYDHRNRILQGQHAIAKVTPIMGFVVRYHIVGDRLTGFVKPTQSETEYIWLTYFLAAFAIATLMNKTKKFENKLLIKALMCIDMFMFALFFFSRYN